MTYQNLDRESINSVLNKAELICAKSGGRFTEKRKRILETLLQSDVPLSAYEITSAYNQAFDTNMPVMSVYRILDFLESEHLAHKLSSTNKYVACSHITCCDIHAVPQFLICGQCQSVKEIAIPKNIVEELERQVTGAGYRPANSQLELQCVCEQCIDDVAMQSHAR